MFIGLTPEIKTRSIGQSVFHADCFPLLAHSQSVPFVSREDI